MCEGYYFAMYREVGNLNPYALDYPVCLEDASTVAGRARRNGRSQRTWLMNHMLPGLFTQKDAEGNELPLSEESKSTMAAIRKTIGLEPASDYEPCAESYMTQYMNRADVKEAIHVKSDIEWEDCSTTIRYKEADRHHDVSPIYNYLIDGGYNLNILVFSGDDDDVCATIGTQDWIWDLGYNVAGKAWQPYTVDGQVGGYLTKWKNTKFAFATVHGAGHEVPAYKPEIAYWLWESYLKGELTNE